MKRTGLHRIILVFLIVPSIILSQEMPLKGYRLEDEDVVFTFDRRDYEKITHENSGQLLDFKDLDIENVVVSGEFNNWSMKQWRMTKIDNNIYELRKHLNDFSDAFSWEFKYVINNAYWAEPSKYDPNIAKATKNGYRLRGIYNLKMYLAYPDKHGNAHFKLNGFNNAKKVIVAGSFNKWNETLFKMQKANDGWELTLKIKPGVYDYRFIVDGKWIEDPHNNKRVENEFGEYNSVIDIKKPITFYFPNHLKARQVILSGSFNHWSEDELKMTKINTGWQYTIRLSGGKHHYKFIVDGEWVVDPENPVMEYDGDGHINSVYMVR
ncbi:hypothetical protein [Aestuariivivens sediminis]|uniref:hypothetical protein n=1 Tax=Aestuariivivens sediminis TaxID=2913557 RepID=UPI001F5940E1|nr:hypothetical protein [Aestuariivivens sediminis]